MDKPHALARLMATAVMAGLLTAACEDSDPASPTRPTRATTTFAAAGFTLGFQPSFLARRPVFGAVCPFRQPFFVPFNLLISGSAVSPLFLNQVHMQFIDSFGTAGPQLTIPQPDLMNLFGTVEIPVLGARTFPMSFQFGCGTRPVGNLGVFVQTIDVSRVIQRRTVTIPIR